LPDAGFVGDGSVADAFEDAGVFDPAGEIVCCVLVGFVSVAFETEAFHVEAGGLVVAAAELDDIVAEDTEGAEFALKFVGVVAVPRGEFGGVAADEDDGEMIGHATRGGFGEFGGIGGELGGPGEGVLLGEPLWVAALFPLVKVLLGDLPAGEIALKDCVDLGEGVEPLDETTGFFAVGETAVELGADFARETSYFAGSSHRLVIWIAELGVRNDWVMRGIGGSGRCVTEICDVRAFAEEEYNDAVDPLSFEFGISLFEKGVDAFERLEVAAYSTTTSVFAMPRLIPHEDSVASWTRLHLAEMFLLTFFGVLGLWRATWCQGP
jgi:hypothetical protein